jgi:glycosyltransferase involved in cell wall biosynthesis
MAKPIIASNIACFAEVLSNDVNALLVKPRDSAEIARALDRLARDSALCFRLGQAARRDAVERFDSNASFAKVEMLFREVAGRNPARKQA